MSVPEMNGSGPMVAPDPTLLVSACLASAETLARKAAGATSMAEAKDAAQAALLLAQTVITLDPTRLAGGDTPEARAAAIPPVSDGDRDGQIGEG